MIISNGNGNFNGRYWNNPHVHTRVSFSACVRLSCVTLAFCERANKSRALVRACASAGEAKQLYSNNVRVFVCNGKHTHIGALARATHNVDASLFCYL